jgi:hypothetical protein
MTDIVLFRYRPANEYLYDSLGSSTMFFASPENLNDPFDCQIDIDRCLSNAIGESEGATKAYLQTLKELPKFSPSLQRALSGVGICSFSLTLTDPLMWAHYADNHRGVCLTYRFEESFFLDEGRRIIGVAPVEYGASPLRHWFKAVAPTLGEPASRAMGTELCKKLFTVKGECWSYEREIRAIREIPGLFEVPRDSLTQICFGLRTMAEVKATVRSCVTHRPVTYCQIIRDGTDFGIAAKEI